MIKAVIIDVDGLIAETDPPVPGLRQFVSRCRGNGFKIAIASGAQPEEVDAYLTAIGSTRSEFDSVLDASDVPRTKPFPDLYLRTAVLLGVSPTACLAVENDQQGVKAAVAAGARCLGLAHRTAAGQLAAAGAEWTTVSLAEPPAEALSW